MLAVAALGAGPAFPQTPVVPATTVAGQPDDQSKLDPNHGEDKPKAEKPDAAAPKAAKPEAEAPKAEAPKAEAPKAAKPEVEAPKAEAPKAEPPKAEAPKAEAPKAEKPTTEAPKAEKPNAEAPKADKPVEPRGDKPDPEKSTPAAPKPTTESPSPPQPKPNLAGPTSAQPNEPGREPQVDRAKPVSPRPKAAPFVAAPPVRHITTTRSPAAERIRTAARGPASAAGGELSGTSSARSGGDSADATSVASGPAAVAPGRARLPGSARVATGAAASLDRQQPRGLILGGPPRNNVVTPLLLAILYAAGVACLIRREVRRRVGLGTRRPALTHVGARPWPAANGRERVDRLFRRGLLRTGSSRPWVWRPAPARLVLPVANNQQSRRDSRLPSDWAFPAQSERAATPIAFQRREKRAAAAARADLPESRSFA